MAGISNDFNLESARCLIGNWQNDRMLIQDGYKARVMGAEVKRLDSFERVMPRCRQARGQYESMNKTAQLDVTKPKSIPAPGPRGLAQAAELELEATRFVSETTRPRTEAPEYLTQTARVFTKPADARDLPAAGLPRMASPQRGAKSSSTEESKGEPVPDVYVNGYYGSTGTVTLYTSRYPEGWLAKTATSNVLDPFGRSYAFSSSLKGGRHGKHAEAMEGVSGVQELGSSMRTAIGPAQPVVAPGSELALKAMFTRFIKRTGEALAPSSSNPAAGLQAFVEALEHHAHQDASPDEEVALGATTGGALTGHFEDHIFVTPEAFRTAAYAAKLQMHDRDLEAVIAACDADGSKRVSLGALMYHARATGLL